VAGSMGGAATFTYETGPDGKSYAVGGEVPVDMSGGRTPEETVARAAQIRAAALAPADPSPQDLAVAAEATAMEAAAREQIAGMQQQSVDRSAQVRKNVAIRASSHEAPLPLPGQRAKSEAAYETSSVNSSAAPIATDAQIDDVQTDFAAQLQTSGSSAPSTAQLQQLARLATIAYRGVGP
jgi:hypothetical protein